MRSLCGRSSSAGCRLRSATFFFRGRRVAGLAAAEDLDCRARGGRGLGVHLDQQAHRLLAFGAPWDDLARPLAAADEAIGPGGTREAIAIGVAAEALVPGGVDGGAQARGVRCRRSASSCLRPSFSAMCISAEPSRNRRDFKFGIEQRLDVEGLRPRIPDVEQRILVEAGLQHMLPFRDAIAILIPRRSKPGIEERQERREYPCQEVLSSCVL